MQRTLGLPLSSDVLTHVGNFVRNLPHLGGSMLAATYFIRYVAESTGQRVKAFKRGMMKLQ